MEILLIFILSYILGSIPSGYWLGKLVKGINIREFGSGNIGATNAVRVLGWKVGGWVYPIDFSKGLIAVLIAKSFTGQESIAILAGLFALLGNLFSIFLKFKGGKGVLTSAGILTGLAPLTVVILLVLFGIVFWKTRIISAGSLAAAFFLPVVFLVEFFTNWGDNPGIWLVLLGVFIGLFIIWKHKANIKRLMEGTEPKFSSK